MRKSVKIPRVRENKDTYLNAASVIYSVSGPPVRGLNTADIQSWRYDYSKVWREAVGNDSFPTTSIELSLEIYLNVKEWYEISAIEMGYRRLSI